jgi:hypothetical protein
MVVISAKVLPLSRNTGGRGEARRHRAPTARFERRGMGHMTYTVQRGARVLWCLRRRKSDVRCVIYAQVMPVEIRVLQDLDLILTESFPEEWLAPDWARVYADRLKQQGWYDSPGG